MSMKNLYPFLVLCLILGSGRLSGQLHWTAADGLPTGEIRQIIALPNGQMLVNCEGVFCLSNGRSFDMVTCDQNRCYTFRKYVNRYGQMWQGDSLLWLHDFYRIYLFDARSRAFRYDIDARLNEPAPASFLAGETPTPAPTEKQWEMIGEYGIRDVTRVVSDEQGGLWVGTRTNGIFYCPPPQIKPQIITTAHPLIEQARSTHDSQGRLWMCKSDGLTCEYEGQTFHYDRSNVPTLPHNRTTFITQLSEQRYLLCDSLCLLGYFVPEKMAFKLLNTSLPSLDRHRHIVGACVIDAKWTAVYTQNGIFLLDTEADSLAVFPAAQEIERRSSKYNCMLKDSSGMLWVGTQNGLFRIADGKTENIPDLNNHCIRSLVTDAHGHVWAGTSCGISRVSPTVVNLGESDGVPPVTMMERAACLTDDSLLVFAFGGNQAVAFRPDEIIQKESPRAVILTRLAANDTPRPIEAEISLKYDSSTVNIQFSTLDYASMSRTRYRYRLIGLNDVWETNNEGRGQVSVTYNMLPPGTYLFEAQATTTSDTWGPVTSLYITVLPPLWLTWWAKLLYFLAILVTVTYLIHLYLKRRKAKMERDNEARVNRLFELREEARRQFAASTNITAQDIAINTEEEHLVSAMLKAIEEHLDDENYNADQLARDVAMSRASLYNKLKTMLGITPTDFIRNVRLKRAARLIEDTTLSVNEIATRVGFVTARNFSSQFKKMFGLTPSEYREGKSQEWQGTHDRSGNAGSGGGRSIHA